MSLRCSSLMAGNMNGDAFIVNPPHAQVCPSSHLSATPGPPPRSEGALPLGRCCGPGGDRPPALSAHEIDDPANQHENEDQHTPEWRVHSPPPGVDENRHSDRRAKVHEYDDD